MVRFRRMEYTPGVAGAEVETTRPENIIGFKSGDEPLLAIIDRSSSAFRAIGRKAMSALLRESIKYGDFVAEFGVFRFDTPLKGKAQSSVCVTVRFQNVERGNGEVRHFSRGMRRDYAKIASSPVMGVGLEQSIDAIGYRSASAMVDLIVFLVSGKETVSFTVRDESLVLKDGATNARVFRAEVNQMSKQDNATSMGDVSQ